jgi:transketolase C-terminal domain/subunit
MRSFPKWGEFPISEGFFEAHSALGVKPTDLSGSEHRVFSDLAMVLAMIPDLSRWSKEEKSAIRQIVRAKTGTDELRYVRLL